MFFKSYKSNSLRASFVAILIMISAIAFAQKNFPFGKFAMPLVLLLKSQFKAKSVRETQRADHPM